jgi:hypothetical protein
VLKAQQALAKADPSHRKKVPSALQHSGSSMISGLPCTQQKLVYTTCLEALSSKINRYSKGAKRHIEMYSK